MREGKGNNLLKVELDLAMKLRKRAYIPHDPWFERSVGYA
jgi:hypothetical protein